MADGEGAAVTIYVGIDAGLTGAVAVLPQMFVWDTPIMIVSSGKRERRDYVIPAMVDLLRQLQPLGDLVVVALERQRSMPRQGVASAFSIGRGQGIWEGILAALKLPYDIIEPARWKRVMMDGMGKEKDAARLRASQLFPSLASEVSRKKDHGRAEALLLAAYRQRLG